ncbi:hypothetical protein UFOVP1476_46 [uncultured Caudovirales phage]|uniref:Uncharacterized protein n=1 Tax=uncultured Caudovirales phage TaxID=2100421 RepID=A0A6J5PTG3_9CAUD|nr:hypothetical protein UFOVP944_53 [uncultured Caudovirales phage]CAB4203280.1 hypothetical protein UFOVP1381_20 [uncultured Caudovirales phage]CAB4216119.1 hypothetical protein UFOVP1476_46 [uncultured Caudovirales phage]
MAARPTMTVPISETYKVLGGTGAYFSEEDVQDALDATGTPVEMLSLSALPDALGTGGVTYETRFELPFRPGAEFEFFDAQFDAIDPELWTDSIDKLRGIVVFSEPQDTPIYVRTTKWDIAAASERLIVARIGQLHTEFDVEITGAAKAARSQQIKALESQLRELRRGSGLGRIPAERHDFR